MKDLFRSVPMAFAMFAIVPAPVVEWAGFLITLLQLVLLPVFVMKEKVVSVCC